MEDTRAHNSLVYADWLNPKGGLCGGRCSEGRTTVREKVVICVSTGYI